MLPWLCCSTLCTPAATLRPLFVQVICAFAIAGVIAAKLYDVSFQITDGGKVVWSDEACLLGTAVGSSTLCDYMYAVVAFSLLFSLVISLVQCLTCNLCGVGSVLDVVFAIIGTVWWSIAAVVVTKNGTEANSQDIPEPSARNAVIALAWTEVALFVVLVVSGCCRCMGKFRSKEESMPYIRSDQV